MGADIEDLRRIKEANFNYNITFAAQTMLVSLAGLREIATKLSIPIEQITVEHIIEEFRPMDEKIRENQRMMEQHKTKRKL